MVLTYMVLFVEGTALRAREFRAFEPRFSFQLEPLAVAVASSAPEPCAAATARVMAVTSPAFAEASDLVDANGRSLRLEYDSEPANRFCRYYRESPATLLVALAMRRGESVEVVRFKCDGAIAHQPRGPVEAGWECVFVPNGEKSTFAELALAGSVATLRRDLMNRVLAYFTIAK